MLSEWVGKIWKKCKLLLHKVLDLGEWVLKNLRKIINVNCEQSPCWECIEETKCSMLNFTNVAWYVNTKISPFVNLYGNPLCTWENKDFSGVVILSVLYCIVQGVQSVSITLLWAKYCQEFWYIFWKNFQIKEIMGKKI